MSSAAFGVRTPDRVEWPTVGLFLVIVGGLLALTWFHASLPWYVMLPVGAYLGAWYSSLQHEIVHGHPTPSPLVNALMGGLPVLLWLPFGIYRASHLAHHQDEHLTDPLDDPESYYVTAAAWRRLPRWRRGLLLARNSLVGRTTIGSVLVVLGFLVDQARALVADEAGVRRAWLAHAAGLALLLGWLVLAGMPLWQYALLIAWPATSLMLVRSFLEHQARPLVEHRTVIVEAGPLMRLLYLNNNLHLVHHARPGLPWYLLPEAYARDRAGWLWRNDGYVFEGGYGEILRRYALRAKEPPVHPFADDRPDETVPTAAY